MLENLARSTSLSSTPLQKEDSSSDGEETPIAFHFPVLAESPLSLLASFKRDLSRFPAHGAAVCAPHGSETMRNRQSYSLMETLPGTGASVASHKPDLIGIGAAVACRPLPHHRAYGSVHGGSRSYGSSSRITKEDRASESMHWKARQKGLS